MMIDIPTKDDEKKWTMAGVAAFLSLKFDWCILIRFYKLNQSKLTIDK